jgi:hypothetical protein
MNSIFTALFQDEAIYTGFFKKINPIPLTSLTETVIISSTLSYLSNTKFKQQIFTLTESGLYKSNSLGLLYKVAEIAWNVIEFFIDGQNEETFGFTVWHLEKPYDFYAESEQDLLT